jgi:predicted Zn finger-like uncharacterized protein
LNNFDSKVQIINYVTDTKSELNTVCPKCQTRIRLSAEQIQNEQTYRCTQCNTIHDMEPLRNAVQNAREGKGPGVRKYTSQITIHCPKCHAGIPLSEEQLQVTDTYSCPQCRFMIDMAPFRLAIIDARKSGQNIAVEGTGKRHIEKYEIASICPKCQTRIPISQEQVQIADSYSCPQCGTINDMAPLRKAVENERKYRKSGYNVSGAGHKDGKKVTYNLPGTESWEKRNVSLSTGAIIRLAVGILIIAVIAIMLLYRWLNPG